MELFDIDLSRMIRYLQTQSLTSQENQWVRERKIRYIVELASQKGYYSDLP
jgi:hypothetical protein